ncbi:ELMO family protein LMO1 [Nakaseomyces bracarensis]|uniref:ELMO family protein LMO1 n=1 Tax=Nakaseomyces bracarensis TaxID=273131 RepID=A0ABR4P0P5_9SACH
MGEHQLENKQEEELINRHKEDMLSVEESRKNFDILKLESNDRTSTEFQRAFSQFVEKCEDKVLYEEIIPTEVFWVILKETSAGMPPELLGSMLNHVFNLFLSQDNENRSGFTTLCDNMENNHNIMESILINLTLHSLHVSLVADTLKCISSFLKCSMLLAKYNLEKAVRILPAICFLLLEYNFPTIVTLLLAVDDLRPLIISEYLPVKMELAKFLSENNMENSSPELRERFHNATRNTNVFFRSYELEFGELTNTMEEIDTLSILQIYDTLSFLESSNTEFIKNFTEQLLFKSSPFPFFQFIYKVSIEVQKFFTKFNSDMDSRICLASHILNRETLLEALMCCLLRLWSESQAKTEGDKNSVLQLVPILLEKVYESTKGTKIKRSESLFEIGIDLLESVDHATARMWQLEMIRGLHYEQWSDQISDFEDMLTKQVNDYVRHQRLLQLQKGTWVYAENPLDEENEHPSVYYIVVSDNHSNLLARKFSQKLDETPYVEDNLIWLKSESGSYPNHDNTIVIPLKTIDYFASKELRVDNGAPEFPQMVNISKKNIYTEVKLLDKNHKKLLRIFLDTKEASYIWLDGLMLISKSKSRSHLGVSKDTNNQIQTLIKLRRDVQLINLPFRQEIDDNNSETIDEEKYYDLDTLKSLPNSFYFE